MFRRKIKDIQEHAKNRGISLERRLFLYWLIMVLAVMAAVFVVLIVAGVFSNDARKLGGTLSVQQKNTTMTFNKLIDTLNAQNLALSEQITREVADILETEERTFKDLDNNPELITRIEERMCFYLQTIVRSRSCSGAYFILDATTNTEAPGADRSRMGLYLRSGNVGTDGMANQYITFFRGVADVARKENIQMHNRWNLEFDIDNVPGYEILMGFDGRRILDCCYLSNRVTLSGTWEQVVLLSVPVVLEGKVRGVCGVELSELFFNLVFPAVESSYGNMVTVVAPIADKRLLLDGAISGKTDGTYFTTDGTLLIKNGEHYNTYSDGSRTYFGNHIVIPKAVDGRSDLTLVTLVPEISYQSSVAKNRTFWLCGGLGFLVLMLLAAMFLTRRFMLPIQKQIRALKDQKEPQEKSNSGIIEIDELLAYMYARQAKPDEESKMPPGMEELFFDFARRVETLTPMERTVLQYYINGFSVNEIAEKEFISLSTVRKHNSNINRKLGVSTREELLLYIDMFRRCDLMEKIAYCTNPEKKRTERTDEQQAAKTEKSPEKL
ncbi:MAG: response regulator transcription factor [Clostridium sp.]